MSKRSEIVGQNTAVLESEFGVGSIVIQQRKVLSGDTVEIHLSDEEFRKIAMFRGFRLVGA